MAECSECGQHVTTWNDQREREVENLVVMDLLRSLTGDWKKVADNAVELELVDGYVVVLVRPYIKEN